MSNNTPNHFTSAYENQVIHFYQQKMQRLRGTCRRRSMAAANAQDLTFFRMGKSTADERARGDSLTPQNQDMPTAKVTPVEINALNWIDRQDAKRMTYDSKDAFAMSQAAALARKADAQIIDAAYAGFTAGGATAPNFSGSTVDLKHLVAVEALLANLDVPDEGMLTVVISPFVWAHFILFEAFNSADWVSLDDRTVNKKTRVIGKYWNGMNIIRHTGLTTAGTGAAKTVECLAYHESALGHATITDMSVETAPTLSNNKPGLNVNSYFDAGAVCIDPEGVLKFTMKEVNIAT